MKRAFQLFLFVGLMLLISTRAQAQILAWEDRGFLNISFGYQNKAATELAFERSFTLYDETARIAAGQTVETSGGFPDFTAGARVVRNFGLGIGFNQLSTETSSALSASVPHPLFYDQPRAATASIDGLKHSERALHLMALYVLPLSDKFDVMLSAGPTFFSVEQDTPNLAAVQIGADVAPYTAVSMTSVGKVTTKESKVGLNVGVDATIRVTKNVGFGGFVRYAAASIDVTPTGLSEAIKVEVGGMQYGGGIRIRF